MHKKIAPLALVCALAAFSFGMPLRPGPDREDFSGIVVGESTYDDIMRIDPDAKALVLSYGYFTSHTLANGDRLYFKCVYEDGDFVVSEMRYKRADGRVATPRAR